jgi:crotonobetainyl-CoA:carnitine CoA-transferase CaiB-like acyl-CoA transferase
MIARQAEWSGGQTVDLQLAVADSYTSLHGVIAILTALRLRDATGVGQHIDLPMLGVLHSVDDYAHWALDGLWPKPEENSVWDAPEHRQILIVGDMKWLWLVLSTQGGLPDPTPEGADVPTKVRLRREAMAAHFAGFADFAALTAHLDRLNLAWGEVNPFDARVYDQPSAQHLGVTVDITDDAGQARRTIQSPWRFSAAPTGLCGDEQIAPTGADNHSALGDWLGLDSAAVDALLAQGVLRS